MQTCPGLPSRPLYTFRTSCALWGAQSGESCWCEARAYAFKLPSALHILVQHIQADAHPWLHLISGDPELESERGLAWAGIVRFTALGGLCSWV